MSNLILQSIQEENLDEALKLLTSKKLLGSTLTCSMCGNKIKKEDIGGFLPNKNKVSPVCDATECTIKVSYLIMKYNGNGSPIIEE